MTPEPKPPAPSAAVKEAARKHPDIAKDWCVEHADTCLENAFIAGAAFTAYPIVPLEELLKWSPNCHDKESTESFKEGWRYGHAAATQEGEELAKALEFYAERNNWRSPDYDSECKQAIVSNDLGVKSFNGENNYADFAIPSGGRRAREALAKRRGPS